MVLKMRIDQERNKKMDAATPARVHRQACKSNATLKGMKINGMKIKKVNGRRC
jgi:hypothetical protein